MAHAQGITGGAVIPGHRLDGLLRGADDDGQHHDGQGKAAGQHRPAEAQLHDEQDEAEEPQDDGGHPRQAFGPEPDDPGGPAFPGILGEVNGGPHSQG